MVATLARYPGARPRGVDGAAHMNGREWRDDWAQAPRDESAAVGWAHHDVAICANGDVVAFHPGEPILLVYRPDGSLRRTVPVPVTEAHGLTLVDRDGAECLWIADNGVKPRRQADGGY